MMNESSLKLSGHFSEFPLPEVIQFLGMTEKCGALRVFQDREDEYVSLYFKEGNLLHVTSPSGTTDIGGFYSLLSMETGHFKFIKGEQAPEITINKPINMLLMESHTYLDELNHIKRQLPPEETILFIEPYLEKVPPLNTFEWQIISMVNGRRTIKRICQKIGDELLAKTTLWKLLTSGVVVDVHPDSDWLTLIPLHVPNEECREDRSYPPLLRTNLLFKAVDDHSSLYTLKLKLHMNENEMIEDIKLLHETHWIQFNPSQERIFSRLRNEM